MDYGTYELRYKIDNTEILMKFSGDINLDTLAENLRYFLLACSWLPSQIDEILGVNE